MTLDILFEDNHLLVCNKKAGMKTQPDWAGQSSLVVEAKQFIKKRDQKPGEVFLEPIHRIDAACSGIVVMAKTSKALSRCMKAVRDKLCRKEYLTVVEGPIDPLFGTLQDYLIHDNFRARITSKKNAAAKKAILDYQVLYTIHSLSVMHVLLNTGRYHQIRAQFSNRGHPIVGDKKYGSQLNFGNKAIALHHVRFAMPHPITHQEIVFKSLPSPIWQTFFGEKILNLF